MAINQIIETRQQDITILQYHNRTRTGLIQNYKDLGLACNKTVIRQQLDARENI